MGSHPDRRLGEVGALRLGLDLGMTLVDTAEMYGDGASERLVGEAIAGRRDEVVLVTKVLPQNASLEGTIAAAERSLSRLRTDRIDLYLLHWEGAHPLSETLAAFERLRESGKILRYGLSNFDAEGLRRAEALPGGPAIAANQVYYNLRHRGIERSLLPWCAGRGIAVMAYTPLDDGRLCREGGVAGAINKVAGRHDVSAATVCIAWTLRHPGVVSIPKAASPGHVRANAAAAGLRLTEEDLLDLDAAYPAPSREIPLETV